jgi:hypothetical protein
MKRLALIAATLAATHAHAQTLVPLLHQAPKGGQLSFQLTDGRVLVQSFNPAEWYTLTPDAKGRYQTGTWAQVGRLPANYAPLAFASAVLPSGKLVIAGGEYNFGTFLLTDLCAVFDPQANTWASLAPPAGWGRIGDSPSVVLPNGAFLVGRKLDTRMAALDPVKLTWTEVGSANKADFNAEEGWTLLPDGSVLTWDVKAGPNAELYRTLPQRWTQLGSTGVNLAGPPEAGPLKYPGGIYTPPGETGPGILRPDGTVFATGAANIGTLFGHTAIYTPGPLGAAGTWAAGPNFPQGEDAADSFAALLPTGNVLVEGAQTGELYEFDGKTLHDTGQNGGYNSLMVLPSGEILVGGAAVYRAAGTVNPAWAPVITTFPGAMTQGATYKISGQQFNGLSQANAFGDEYQTATNYPLARITYAHGEVAYFRTHDHSTMAVATGTLPVFTYVDVPDTAQTGPARLQIVANGIASVPVDVRIFAK